MPLWFYSSNGQQLGPVEEAQIRSLFAGGRIKPEDLVWAEGMPQWIPASQTFVAAAPAPMIPPPSMPAARPTTARPAGAPMPPAAPTLITTAADTGASPLAIVADDAGPFFKLASMFTIPDDGRWTGTAVGSPRAIYLLKKNKSRHYGHGGLLIILIAAAVRTGKDIRTCALPDLPQPVRDALDPKGKSWKKDVIVLPRDAIRLIKLGALGTLTVQIGPESFAINGGLFAGKKNRELLEQLGWSLDQETFAAGQPIHGPGFGRTFEEIQQRRKSARRRALFAGLAAAAIIAIIVLIAMQH